MVISLKIEVKIVVHSIVTLVDELSSRYTYISCTADRSINLESTEDSNSFELSFWGANYVEYTVI